MVTCCTAGVQSDVRSTPSDAQPVSLGFRGTHPQTVWYPQPEKVIAGT